MTEAGGIAVSPQIPTWRHNSASNSYSSSYLFWGICCSLAWIPSQIVFYTEVLPGSSIELLKKHLLSLFSYLSQAKVDTPQSGCLSFSSRPSNHILLSLRVNLIVGLFPAHPAAHYGAVFEMLLFRRHSRSLGESHDSHGVSSKSVISDFPDQGPGGFGISTYLPAEVQQV